MKLEFPLKKVHMIGIGGVGISAIAEMLLSFGVKVQGSDVAHNQNTRRLELKGVTVFIGHKAENIEGVEAVIASTAVPEDNPEIQAARQKRIPVGRRSEILAEILRYRQGICVSGTHGKTTTSSLITHVLKEAGIEPSCIVGGILNSYQSNSLSGQGKWLVVEADESDETFLKLPTRISVVTNINPEHIAYHYGTFENYRQAFEIFVKNTAFYGCSVMCTDHPFVMDIYERIHDRMLISYGLNEKAQIRAENIHLCEDKSIFDVVLNLPDHKDTWKNVTLSLIGEHNIQNALGVIGVSLFMGVEKEKIIHALGCFQGVQRRLTKRAVLNQIKFYDDYAVHPTEIKTTLKALDHIKGKGKIHAFFQPHRYTRMEDLWDEFMESFDLADNVFVTDIYSAGEAVNPSYTQDRMIKEMKKHHDSVMKVSDLTQIDKLVSEYVSSGDTVIFLGAGSISAACQEALKKLESSL